MQGRVSSRCAYGRYQRVVNIERIAELKRSCEYAGEQDRRKREFDEYAASLFVRFAGIDAHCTNLVTYAPAPENGLTPSDPTDLDPM